MESVKPALMKQRKRWPYKSDGFRFSTALPLSDSGILRKPTTDRLPSTKVRTSSSKPTTSSSSRSSYASSTARGGAIREHDLVGSCADFSALPDDILSRIAATFSHPNLVAVSLVCKSWCVALRPLREAMEFLKWGKRFKHGRGGVRPNREKALDSFLKGARRGSTMAMVDAGLVYWEMGKKDEGLVLYRRAAELGDPAGQFNLGIALLQAESPKMADALKWLWDSACAGYIRAQYQLALCLHKGRGINRNLTQSARWCLRAAEGGYARAMYNVSLCYSSGEGFPVDHKQAKKWMKAAADHGHSKAQFEHGLSLFIDGEMAKSFLYLELAIRAGETAAVHVKNAVAQQISEASLNHAMHLADQWRPLSSTH